MDEPLGLVNGPHDDPAKCPTYYDGCNCTVETLKHNLNCLRLVEEGRDSLLLQRDDYKAKWEKLMAAIGPYSTTDLAAKMAEGARLQISEERERCAKIVDGKIPIGGPRGMASLVLLTHIAKEIRAGVPLKPKHESEER